jgi:hypothetical protein
MGLVDRVRSVADLWLEVAYRCQFVSSRRGLAYCPAIRRMATTSVVSVTADTTGAMVNSRCLRRWIARVVTAWNVSAQSPPCAADRSPASARASAI